MLRQNSEKFNPLLYLFRKTWQYSTGNRPVVALYWAMFVVACALEIFFHPFIGAKMMNIVQEKGLEDIRGLLLLAVMPIAVELVFWLIHGPARVMETVNGFLVRANYRKYLLQGVLTLPMDWHTDHHSGDTIDKIEKGTGALYQFSKDSFEIVYSIVQLIGSFAILAYFSPSSIPIVTILLAVSVWITTRFDRVMIPQYKELNHKENEISESVFDAISNISTVIILRVERLVFRAITVKIDRPLALFKRNSIINETKWFLVSMCTALMTASVLMAYFWHHWKTGEVILVGSVFLLHRYLSQMSQIFFRFSGMYSDIVVGKAKLSNSEELAQEFISENLSNHVLPSSWEKLEINNLNFSYIEDDTRLHLEEINLTLHRGEKIALIGESGSGKTTLLKVMRDLYHPRSLTLKVDGEVIQDGFAGISRAISLVPQNPEIFATTILENITLGAEYEKALIEHFLKMACFDQVVKNLPHGLESSIKEKGVNLSGGQQQRLALARGLIACQDKEIVLLDEPTASLDTSNEIQIYRNIFNEMPDKTVISSVHRLHLLPLFDRIYLFSNGQIDSSGTLGELLSNSSLFQQMWFQYHQTSR